MSVFCISGVAQDSFHFKFVFDDDWIPRLNNALVVVDLPMEFYIRRLYKITKYMKGQQPCNAALEGGRT